MYFAVLVNVEGVEEAVGETIARVQSQNAHVLLECLFFDFFLIVGDLVEPSWGKGYFFRSCSTSLWSNLRG